MFSPWSNAFLGEPLLGFSGDERLRRGNLPHPILYPHHIHHFPFSGTILSWSGRTGFSGFVALQSRKTVWFFDIEKPFPYNGTTLFSPSPR